MLRIDRNMATNIAAVIWAALVAGCSTTTTDPEVLVIDSDQYFAAFDAAIEAARTQRMTAILRDRRQGVIETEPAAYGSALDPWHGGSGDVGQLAENTVSYQRHRARFEFIPLQGAAASLDAEPNVLGQPGGQRDLSEYSGRIEVRVSVFVERSAHPGLQRDTWTRRATSAAIVFDPETGNRLPSQFWTPVGRDVRMELRMLGAVQRSAAAVEQSPQPAE